MREPIIYHKGDVIGRWTILDDTPIKEGKYIKYLCKCECGTIKYVKKRLLHDGQSKSCGCLAREKFIARNKKHGHAHSHLYFVWTSLRHRCNCPSSESYHNYGERGIKVCSEWDDFETFSKWAYSNGYDDTKSGRELSLDRIDVNGDYCPKNCRWISMYDQQDNKRNTIRITYNNETHTIKEWAKITGLNNQIIYQRFRKGHQLSDVFFNGYLFGKKRLSK